jgi:hypothetical protein
VDEGGNLDFPQSGGDQHLHDDRLEAGGHGAGFHLEAVAGADFYEMEGRVGQVRWFGGHVLPRNGLSL